MKLFAYILIPIILDAGDLVQDISIPSPVFKSFNSMYPRTGEPAWKRIGKDVYVAKFNHEGYAKTCQIKSDGTWQHSYINFKIGDLPKCITQFVQNSISLNQPQIVKAQQYYSPTKVRDWHITVSESLTSQDSLEVNQQKVQEKSYLIEFDSDCAFISKKTL